MGKNGRVHRVASNKGASYSVASDGLAMEPIYFTGTLSLSSAKKRATNCILSSGVLHLGLFYPIFIQGLAPCPNFSSHAPPSRYLPFHADPCHDGTHQTISQWRGFSRNWSAQRRGFQVKLSQDALVLDSVREE